MDSYIPYNGEYRPAKQDLLYTRIYCTGSRVLSSGSVPVDLCMLWVPGSPGSVRVRDWIPCARATNMQERPCKNDRGGVRHVQVQRRPGSCTKTTLADVQHVLLDQKELVQVDKDPVERADQHVKNCAKAVADGALVERMPSV